jgi:hypothetical protein
MASHAERLDGTAEDKKKFLVLLTAGLISSLIMLDSNIVAVSLPSIARSLGVTFIPLLHLLLSGCEPNEVNKRSKRGLCLINFGGG